MGVEPPRSRTPILLGATLLLATYACATGGLPLAPREEGAAVAVAVRAVADSARLTSLVVDTVSPPAPGWWVALAGDPRFRAGSRQTELDCEPPPCRLRDAAAMVEPISITPLGGDSTAVSLRIWGRSERDRPTQRVIRVLVEHVAGGPRVVGMEVRMP
jgi:hypothetical protein